MSLKRRVIIGSIPKLLEAPNSLVWYLEFAADSPPTVDTGAG